MVPPLPAALQARLARFVPDTGGMPGPLFVDTGGLLDLSGQLTAVGDRCRDLPAPLRQRTDAAVDEAGEFSGDLEHGAAVFALSWTAAFSAYADCCALLAGNTGRSSLQLVALDEAAAGSLSGPG